jgi:hypothetical protein
MVEPLDEPEVLALFFSVMKLPLEGSPSGPPGRTPGRRLALSEDEGFTFLDKVRVFFADLWVL